MSVLKGSHQLGVCALDFSGNNAFTYLGSLTWPSLMPPDILLVEQKHPSHPLKNKALISFPPQTLKAPLFLLSFYPRQSDSIKVELFFTALLISRRQHSDLYVSVTESPAVQRAQWAALMLLPSPTSLRQQLSDSVLPQRTVKGWRPWAWTRTTPLCCGTGGRGRNCLPCGECGGGVTAFQ